MSIKTILSTLSISAVFTVLAAGAHADNTKTPVLDKKEAHQEKRIEQGVKSGQLTQQEAAKLEADQTKLKADEAAAKADGKVTQKERRELQKEANQDSREIHKMKHNKDKQPKQ